MLRCTPVINRDRYTVRSRDSRREESVVSRRESCLNDESSSVEVDEERQFLTVLGGFLREVNADGEVVVWRINDVFRDDTVLWDGRRWDGGFTHESLDATTFVDFEQWRAVDGDLGIHDWLVRYDKIGVCEREIYIENGVFNSIGIFGMVEPRELCHCYTEDMLATQFKVGVKNLTW